MKQYYTIFFIAICFYLVGIENVVAQSNRNKTITTTTSTSEVSKGSKIFSLSKDGTWVHAELDCFGREEYNKYYGGTYYVDAGNIIHLTRENGYQETATLKYDNSGKVIIYYKGNYYYQSYYDEIDKIYTWKVR